MRHDARKQLRQCVTLFEIEAAKHHSLTLDHDRKRFVKDAASFFGQTQNIAAAI